MSIDGQLCERFSRCEFLRQWNDCNIPATVRAWLSSTGHFLDEFTQTIDLDLEDASRTVGYEYEYDLFETVTAGHVVRIKVTPTQCVGGSANCFVGVQLNEGSDVGAHLLFYLVDGTIYYKNDEGDQTTTTGASDSTKDMTLGSIRYVWIQLQSGLATFKVAVTASATDTPSYSSAFDMPHTLSSGWDTLRVYTPEANDDGGVGTPATEDLESFAHGASVEGAAGEFGTFDSPANLACTCEDEAGNNVLKCVSAAAFGQLGYDIDNHSVSAGDHFHFKVKVAETNIVHNIGLLSVDGNSWVALSIYSDGNLYDSGRAQSLGAYAANTWYNDAIIQFLSATTYKIYIGGSWYDNGGAGFNVQGAGTFSSGVGSIYLNCLTGGTIYADEMSVSWDTSVVVYTSKTLTISLDEAYSDQECVDLDDVKGRCIRLWQNNSAGTPTKLAWKGYCHTTSEKHETDSKDIELYCYDEFYKCGRNDIGISNIRHTSALTSATLNELVLTTAAKGGDGVTGTTTTPDVLKEAWAVIRHNAGTIDYNIDDDATYDTLKTTACTPSTSSNSTITETNTHAKTQAKDNDFHQFHTHIESADAPAYADYTLERTAPAGRTPVSGTVRIEGKSSWVNGDLNSYGFCEAWAMRYDADGNELGYRLLGLVGQNPGSNIGYLVDVPFTTGEFSLDAENVTETGGNWQAKIRLKFTQNGNARPVSDWYIDYLRVAVKASKDISYIPIEARIDTIDSATTFDINSIPVAGQNAAAGDTAMITRSIRSAILAALVLLSGVTVMTDDQFGGMPSDERGNDGATAFKNTCKACGIDFYLDVQEDDTPSILYCMSCRQFFDCCGIPSATEIQNVAGWGRHSTVVHRVTVERTNQVGSYLQFPSSSVADVQQKHDKVYKLLSPDLDTAAPRTLSAFEIYLAFSGTCSTDNTRRIKIWLSGTSDPDQGPFLEISYFKDGASYYWRAVFSGNAGATDIDDVECDAQNTIGIRVELDYDAGTVVLKRRDVILDGATRKLADTWTTIADSNSDLTLTEDPARCVCFSDDSSGATIATNYFRVHQIHLEFEPTTNTGTLTPGGDVTEQKRADRIKSLRVIGGKDADGNEFEHTVVMDTEGDERVELHTDMKSIAEVKRYCDLAKEKYEYDKSAIRMDGYIDNDNVYHPGYVYTFTLDGTERTELLNKASCVWDTKDNAMRWTLDFGGGKYQGTVGVAASHAITNSGKNTSSQVNALKLK